MRGRTSLSHGLCAYRTHCAPIVRAWPNLSRTWPSMLCPHGLRMPSSVLGDRTFCRGQLCRDLKVLCRDRNSPYYGQLCRDIESLYRHIIPPYLSQLCRNPKILRRNRKSSQPDQLCNNIEFLYRNTKLLHLATFCCDTETFCRDRKLLARLTLLRAKNPLSR